MACEWDSGVCIQYAYIVRTCNITIRVSMFITSVGLVWRTRVNQSTTALPQKAGPTPFGMHRTHANEMQIVSHMRELRDRLCCLFSIFIAILFWWHEKILGSILSGRKTSLVNYTKLNSAIRISELSCLQCSPNWACTLKTNRLRSFHWPSSNDAYIINNDEQFHRANMMGSPHYNCYCNYCCLLIGSDDRSA